MGIINKNYIFTIGQTADPVQVNQNFDTMYNEFNGNIDDKNIKPFAVSNRLGTDINQINIKAYPYSAKGDYDPTTGIGTDNTTAIQNAINALPNGGEVLLPTGNFKFTDTLTFGNAKITFKCVGDSSSCSLTFVPADLTKTAIFINASFCTVEGVQLVTPVAVTGWGIDVANGVSSNYVFRNYVSGFQNGVRIRGWHNTAEENRIYFAGPQAGVALQFGDSTADSTTLASIRNYLQGGFSVMFNALRAYGSNSLGNIYEGLAGSTTIGIQSDNSSQVYSLHEWFEKLGTAVKLGTDSYIYHPHIGGTVTTWFDISQVSDNGANESRFYQNSRIILPGSQAISGDKNRYINSSGSQAVRLPSVPVSSFNYPNNVNMNLNLLLIKSINSIIQSEDEVFVNLARVGGYNTFKRILTSPFRVEYGTGIPTVGDWGQQDRVEIPSVAGGYMGYACVRAGKAAPAWAASTAYALNTLILPTANNAHYYKCTTAGTSGTAEPAWPTAAGGTVTDGTVVWTESGTSALFKGYGAIQA